MNTYAHWADEALQACGAYDEEIAAWEERMWRRYERAHIMLSVCVAECLRTKYTAEMQLVTHALLS